MAQARLAEWDGRLDTFQNREDPAAMNATRTSTIRSRASAATLSILGVLLASAALPQSAVGATRDVDPSTLTPAPPDFFNAQCRETGQQILCDLAFIDPEGGTLVPTGIFCDSPAGSFEILDSLTRSVVGTRYYTSDGLLERRHFRDRIDGVFTNSLTGVEIPYEQHTTVLHDLSVLGDPTTGAEQLTTHLRAQSGAGVVLIDAGRIVFSPDDESLTMSGQHPFDEYFVNGDLDALAPLCEALS